MATHATFMAVLASTRVANAQAACAHAMRTAGPAWPGAGAAIETAHVIAAEESNAIAAYEAAIAAAGGTGAPGAPAGTPPADAPPADAVPPADVE